MSKNSNLKNVFQESQLYSMNLVLNNDITESCNYEDDNENKQNNNENNSSIKNNEELLNYQKYIKNYEEKEETKSNEIHFHFTGESYTKSIINEILKDEKTNKNNNNPINEINKDKPTKDLTNNEIESSSSIKSNSHYALFQNKKENACYINVILHYLFSCKIIFDYLVDLYKNWIRNNKDNKENKEQQLKEDINDKEANKKIIKMKKEELMSYLGEILYKYKKALSSKNKISIIPTIEFRKKLGKFSNKFAFNCVADPVEFLIFILEILSEMNEEKISENFYLNIKEEFNCPECQEKGEIKYDKTTFVYQIYMEDIFNYLSKINKKIEDYSDKLFEINQSSYMTIPKECSKKHETEKKIICQNFPNYLIVNCVWNRQPNIEKVLELFILLGLKNKLSDLFEIPPFKKKNIKDLNYYLTHIILFSSSLFHYIIVIYNPSLKIFNLYDDDKVYECDSLPQIIEMITVNLISQNPKYYFYPVLLIYSKYDLYKEDELFIKNKFDKKSYDYLYEKCKKYVERYNEELLKKKASLEKNNNKKNNKKDEIKQNNKKEPNKSDNSEGKKIDDNSKNNNQKGEENKNQKTKNNNTNEKDSSKQKNKEQMNNSKINKQTNKDNNKLNKETKKELKEENNIKSPKENKKQDLKTVHNNDINNINKEIKNKKSNKDENNQNDLLNNMKNNNIKENEKDRHNNEKKDIIKEPKKLNVFEIKISKRKKGTKSDKQSEISKKDDIK